MQRVHEVTFAGQKLVLRADRSLWWPAKKILFIADVHAGKTAHFQAAGARVPAGSLQADLRRLQAAVDELRPERLIVLGDLFHSDINDEWSIVTAWIRLQPCSVELVRGNHDRYIGDQALTDGGIIVHDENLKLDPFTLRHHPMVRTQAGQFVLCGHVHPVHTYRGPGGDKLRLACFVMTAQQIVLPAFGSFTGGYDVVADSRQRLIGAADDFSNLLVAEPLLFQ